MTRPRDRGYASPTAMRRALTDRLRQYATPYGKWALADLQRQYAYDRLLHRLYRASDEWVVKGATALIARGLAVRHTIDIDLYRATTQNQMERDLRSAARLDLDDWMTFAVGTRRPAGRGMAARLPIKAAIGSAPWAEFHVDLVGGNAQMTGAPDDVPPLTPITLPGTDTITYRAYPLADHIGDKTTAILEWHDSRPSTRYKDLVDLVALVTRIAIEATPQMTALNFQATAHNLVLPSAFDVPDRMTWERGYAASARRAKGLNAHTLDQALALVTPFLDPLLEGTAHGTWNPRTARWEQ